MDPATERKLVRAIVRQVHPDLFSAHPYERAKNTEALQALNAYADQLSQGLRPQAAKLTFYVRGGEGEALTEVPAELPAYGSLGPLFYAFGLITQEELKEGYGSCGQGADDRDLAAWLRETVAEAVRTADQHDSLKRVIRDMRLAMEGRFKLGAIQVGGEFAISTAEQRRQIDALKALEGCLAGMDPQATANFEGLNIRLYHPDSRPLGTVEYVDQDGAFNLRTQPITSFVADDGVLHIVADPTTMAEALPKLDLRRARLLARLGTVWQQRSRDLSSVLQEVLGVEAVWCDTRTEDSSQQFVLWAGVVLEQRSAFRSSLQGRRFAFSLLAHSDASSPMLDFLASSSVLQVRCDCPPEHLLDFLCSSAGLIANEAAVQVAEGREEEEQLLEAVREALGAKHVIRVCSSYEQDKVLSAARRLLESAPAIRAAGVNLEGASLAIDDCYELWDSGFISIPHDFSLSDLKPRLQALLGSGGGGQAGGLTSSGDELSVLSAINGGSQFGGSNGSKGGANGSKGSSGADGAFANGGYTNGAGVAAGAGAKQGAYATSGSSNGSSNGAYTNGSTSGKGFGRDSSSNRGSGGSSYRRSGRDNGRAEGAGAYASSGRGSPMPALGNADSTMHAAGAAALRAAGLRQRMRQAVAPPPQRRTGVAAAVRPAARQAAVAARLAL
ncbi:hypothetical protein C2E21_7404 [Chlorella sorokiniana]|uniref:DUF4460 domain-containing protein n=1 Tax=Chlorella sorokiniana TaxID=3076 RepID=A0A2P6TIK2_CHLSO|nr:hypothetical protein C2E21_7404 [Chlorella sorokiniana]|eukprot:PRW34089.1 hypothetical protein C2E21_7404 [Chlorella sorokiniana]